MLRFGANSREVLARLRWMQRRRSGRRSQLRFEVLGEFELKPLMAQALHMGDEVHNRNVAASSLLIQRLVPALLKSSASAARCRRGARVHRRQRPLLPEHLDGGVQGMLDAAHGVAGSSWSPPWRATASTSASA